MNEPVIVTDSTSRKITLQKMDYLTQVRAAKILGLHAANEAYVALVIPCFFITAIDGNKIVIKNENQLEAIIQRLGDEGFKAVSEGVVTHFPFKNRWRDKSCWKVIVSL